MLPLSMLSLCRCYSFDVNIFEVDLPVFDVSYFLRENLLENYLLKPSLMMQVNLNNFLQYSIFLMRIHIFWTRWRIFMRRNRANSALWKKTSWQVYHSFQFCEKYNNFCLHFTSLLFPDSKTKKTSWQVYHSFQFCEKYNNFCLHFTSLLFPDSKTTFLKMFVKLFLICFFKDI